MPRNELDHELDSYGPSSGAIASSSAYPLLGGHTSSSSSPTSPTSPTSPSSSNHIRRSSRSTASTFHRKHPTLYHVIRRWWKPLAAIALPPLLLFLYAYAHPLLPGLPPLPSVKFDLGYGAANDASPEVMVITPTSCVCGTTDRGKQLCSVYHPEGLLASRLVEGTGARIKHMLARAREGEPIKVGVLGGSVSACHGVHPNPDYPQGDPSGPGCYTSLIKSWFEHTFPKSTVDFMNGAIGGMDSSYYAFCGTHHIAPDVDLIILEFDVNDQSDTIYQAYFDQLLRVLLEFQSQPAVLILGSWSPQVAQDQGYHDPQIEHLPIAHYYDIPYISLKRVIFNHYLRFPESTAKTFFQDDLLHPNARGHRILADLLIAYLESEICLLSHYGLPIVPSIGDTIATSNKASALVEAPFALDTPTLIDPANPPDGWEATFDPGPLEALSTELRHFVLPESPYTLPFVPMFTPLRDVIDPRKPDPSSPRHILGLVQPNLFCADANDHDNPMTPTTHEGWEQFVWNGEKHFWVSETVGARIRVEIKVNAGKIAVYYYRSQHYNLGDAKCWVDDNEKGAVMLAGYWDKQYNVAVVKYIDEKVTPGDHYVTCEIAATTSHPHNPSAHHFRIVAVMAT